MNHTKNRIVTILAGLALAIGFFGSSAQPASAMALYSGGGGKADPVALCNVNTHTIQIQNWLYKDPGYSWQDIQVQYKVVDLNTGQVSYTNVLTTRVTTTATIMYSGILRTSGRFQIYHSVRFGTARGLPAWAPWTPVHYSTTWLQQGWVNQATAVCYA
jgi:hypothetical protein